MPNTLAKADIRDWAYDQLGLQKNDSSEIVEIPIEIIKESPEPGEDVLISGFGKFQVKGKRIRNTGILPTRGWAAFQAVDLLSGWFFASHFPEISWNPSSRIENPRSSCASVMTRGIRVRMTLL